MIGERGQGSEDWKEETAWWCRRGPTPSRSQRRAACQWCRVWGREVSYGGERTVSASLWLMIHRAGRPCGGDDLQVRVSH